MSAWVVAPAANLIEPSVAPEFFIDHIGGIELLNNGWVRLYGCSEQMPLEIGCLKPQAIVQVKIVRPLCTVPEAIVGMARCLRLDAAPEIVRAGPRLVR